MVRYYRDVTNKHRYHCDAKSQKAVSLNGQRAAQRRKIHNQMTEIFDSSAKKVFYLI